MNYKIKDFLKYKVGFIIGVCISYLSNSDRTDIFIFPIILIGLSIIELFILQYKD